MRFGFVAILGLIAGAVAAAAQQANAPTVKGAEIKQLQPRYVFLAAGCPGQLQARQQATGGAVVWTTALEDQSDKTAWTARPSGLGIHVEFAGVKTAVKAMELRVSYLPLGLRRMPLDTTLRNTVAESPQERAKTFDLDREAAMQIGGDLLVGPAAMITRVHLVSATFADGSLWRAPDEDACTIEPNRWLLLEAKK
jgi:hypothetical protein